MTIYKSSFEPVEKTYVGGIFDFIFGSFNPNYNGEAVAIIDGDSGKKVSQSRTIARAVTEVDLRAFLSRLPTLNFVTSRSHSHQVSLQKPVSSEETPSYSSHRIAPSTPL